MTLDFVFKTCTGHDASYWAERGELDWFNKYADPREDSGKGVFTANWNHFPRSLASESHRSEAGQQAQQFNWNRGRKFQDILEKMGYKLEWSDQTGRCSNCDGCIQEQPNCYGDTAHYAFLGECDQVCENCIRTDFAEDYLEGLEDNPRSAVHIAGIDPAKYGYVQLESGFENGFHPGQNDNPVEIFKRLREQYKRIVFTVDDAGQFDVRFSVWHKPETEAE